jgi:His-Xaa-Ser system radical SAM maturase HxsC
MLNQKIKCLDYNVFDEVLIYYTSDRILTGFCFVDGDTNDIKIQIVFEVDNIQFESKYILVDPKDFINIEIGDILLFRTNGTLKNIFRINSLDNVLFITEQCNNNCLMCSQPPKNINDLDYYYNLNSKLIEILPYSVLKIGITGGEPTILNDRLIVLINQIATKFPEIEIQLLSNGRQFSDIHYVHKLSEIGKKNLFIGIPLHSDFYVDHDYISQSNNAFNQTLKGLYNLARYSFSIELRVIVNKINYKRLEKISDYIFKNLPFINHVAFMGMEYIGLVPKYNKIIWIDPIEYKEDLKKSVLNLSSWGINVSVFNIPLCLLDENLIIYSVKSISDWKVKYFLQCEDCILKVDCGGSFGTSLKHSPNIKPIFN